VSGAETSLPPIITHDFGYFSDMQAAAIRPTGRRIAAPELNIIVLVFHLIYSNSFYFELLIN
jgi:hypothetical protein